MSEEQNIYRPRSPDLSEFVPRQPSLTRLPSFHAPSDSAFPPGYAFSPRGSYDASPYFSPQTTQGSYFAPQSQTQTPSVYTSLKTIRTPSVPTIPQHQFPAPRQTFTDPVQPRYPPPPTFTTPTYQAPQHISYNHTQPSTLSQPPPSMPRTRQKRPADFDDDYDPNNTTNSGPPPISSAPLAMPGEANDPTLTIDVRTKFPVARIKRIMQADEDVGKVAQATPTAVAKALELFMITLITKGASEARTSSNSKRITAQHLKTALVADKQFDFLNDVCADIPDEGAAAKKGRAKSEAKSEESDEEMGGRKKSKPRKRKASEESD